MLNEMISLLLMLDILLRLLFMPFPVHLRCDSMFLCSFINTITIRDNGCIQDLFFYTNFARNKTITDTIRQRLHSSLGAARLVTENTSSTQVVDDTKATQSQ